MLRSMKRFALLVALLAPPSLAQFGVPGGKRKAGTGFEDLQELAKQKAEGGGGAAGMGDLQKLMAEAMNDPEAMKQMGEFASQYGDTLNQMMNMEPEELQQQMEAAMKMMTDGDIVENVVNQRDEVLKTLESSGLVPPEELEKYKSDPNYFELKMRESFSQMGELFSNPEYVSEATKALKGMGDVMNDPDAVSDMIKMLSAEFDDDDKLEEMRLQFLQGDFGGLPGMEAAFDTPEMKEALKDPKKWKETMQKGLKEIMGAGTPGFDQAKAEL